MNKSEFEAGEIKEGQFNQAQLMMIRIFKIEERVDFFLSSPLACSSDGRLNYLRALGDLDNLLTIVYPKLTPTEKETVLNGKKMIQNQIKTKPISRTINLDGRAFEDFSSKNWESLQELIFEFRLYLSELMDSHGMGNPNKLSAGTSLIN